MTFEDFGKSMFGYEKTQLYQLAKAAEIENCLDSAKAEKPIKGFLEQWNGNSC